MAYNNYPQQQLPQGNQNTRKKADKRLFSDGPLLDMNAEERHTGQPDFVHRPFLTQTTYGYAYPRHPQSPTHPSLVNDGSNDHIPGPSNGMQRFQSNNVSNWAGPARILPAVSHSFVPRTHRNPRQVPRPILPLIAPNPGPDYGFPPPADPPVVPTDIPAITESPSSPGPAQYSYVMDNNRNIETPLYQPSLPSGMVNPVYAPVFDDIMLAPTNNEGLNFFHHSSLHGVVVPPDQRHYDAGMWARRSIPTEQMMPSPIVDPLSPTSIMNTSPTSTLPSSPPLSAPAGYPNPGAFWQTYPNHQGKSICSYTYTLCFDRTSYLFHLQIQTCFCTNLSYLLMELTRYPTAMLPSPSPLPRLLQFYILTLDLDPHHHQSVMVLPNQVLCWITVLLLNLWRIKTALRIAPPRRRKTLKALFSRPSPSYRPYGSSRFTSWDNGGCYTMSLSQS
jgi:hypothetical protein